LLEKVVAKDSARYPEKAVQRSFKDKTGGQLP
jgi:hypothetical protein